MRHVCSQEVVVEGATPTERLERAKGYPYPRPRSSFLFAGGSCYPLSNAEWQGPTHLKDMLSIAAPNTEFDLDGYEGVDWHAVLAIGSNASPQQLARKFTQNHVIIPVAQGVLVDFDVVYAPLVSSYGSCTATLQCSPGTMVEVFVTYLTSPLLERMIQTEGAYDLVNIRNLNLKLGLSLSQARDGEAPREVLTSILQFNHQRGALNLLQNGVASAVSLAEVPAECRQFPALSQVEMLKAIKTRFESPNGVDLDRWILNNLENEDQRQHLVQKLVSEGQPFSYADTEVVARIGTVHSKNVK